MSLKIDNKRILKSAVHVAERDGYMNITRQKIAEHAEVSDAKVSNAYGSMIQLKRAVMRQAIHNKILSIIAEGLISKDPTALKIPQNLKVEALATL